MILQSLCEYYQTQVKADNPDYAPAGMEMKRIHFVIVLTDNGILVDVEQPLKKINVVKSRNRCGKDAYLMPNYMWDNLGFVTDYGADEKQQVTATIQHISFKEQVRKFRIEFPTNTIIAAVDDFYAQSDYPAQLQDHPLWSKIISLKGHNLSFRLLGETLLAAQQPELVGHQSDKSKSMGECLVSGSKAKITSIHPKVAIAGGSPTGAKIVSFTKKCGYDSYYKKNGDNAPMSVEMAEAYTATLNGLLDRDSSNRIIVGDVSFIFFSLPNSGFNELFRMLIDPAVKTDRNELIGKFIDFAYSKEAEAEFVLMALVPNAARISVRLYLRTTIEELCENILDFYNGITLEHHFDIAEPIALLAPLFYISPQNNISKLPVQFIVDYLYAVVTHSPLPIQFQTESLNRLRESREINLGTTMMLRCYINQKINSQNRYIPMALDKENNNTGYLLGRTFAILERAQEISNPGSTFTIRDAYYNVISVTPLAVFNRLIGLSNTFFRKIYTKNTAIYLKIQLGEVTDMLQAEGIPARLSLDDQSRFALGYFHQRQTYFTKREPNEQGN